LTGPARENKVSPTSHKDTLELPRGSKTLCLPFEPASYPEVVKDKKRFRSLVDEVYTQHPELFPAAMGEGYTLHDTQLSAKLGIGVRRIKLKATDEVYGLCPAFVMPYMAGYTADVEHALFLQHLGVPFWALPPHRSPHFSLQISAYRHKIGTV
jgi:hypothetical protein